MAPWILCIITPTQAQDLIQEVLQKPLSVMTEKAQFDHLQDTKTLPTASPAGQAECLSLGSRWRNKEQRKVFRPWISLQVRANSPRQPCSFPHPGKHTLPKPRWLHPVQASCALFIAHGANYHRNTEEGAEAVSVWCDTYCDNLWPFSLKKEKKLPASVYQ